VVSLGTGIIRPVTHEVLGVIIVDIDKSAIEDICKGIRIGGNGYFSLMSMENEPVYIFSSDPNFNFEKLNKTYRDRITMEPNGYFTEKMNGQNYFYVFNTLSNTGWKIIGKVRLQDLMQRAYSIRNITIIVVLVCILSTAILYFFISEKLTLPIVDLKDKMKQAEQGNLTVIAECKNKDEIADLCSSFNVMLENIKQLIEKNKKEQEALKKSELKLMQAQINPHFLYNTLDTIVWLSEAKESASVIEISKALSGFFRATLSSGREWITLEEEIDHIRNYLIIQKMRYMDILDYRIDILDEDILNCKILKLILQPVIENALYHGVKNKNSYGLIIIKVSKASEGNIMLEVIDNGQGMTAKRLEIVMETINNESLNVTKDGGFGLRNVNQRIKLYYGRQYGLDIKSKYTEGTHVSMIIPEVR
jgi:two-component system sensor histidine kinase YesM